MEGSLAYWGPEEYTEEQLLAKLQEPCDTVSCDVETVSVKDRWLLGIGVALSCTESVYARVYPDPSPHLPLLLNILERANTIVWHNGIFDLTVLLEWCIDASLDLHISGDWASPSQRGLPGKYTIPTSLALIATKSQDTSLMSQVQALPDLNLKDMSHTYAMTELDAISDILPARQNMLSLPWDVTANKCLHDVLGTLRLWYQMRGPEWCEGHSLTWTHEDNYNGPGFYPDLPNTHYVGTGMQECYDVDRRMIPLLLRMTARGIKLRPAKVRTWYEELSQRRLVFQDICTKEGFNPGSNQQVGYVLASRGTHLPFTKSKKQLKVDIEVLESLNDPLAAVVTEHRKLTKLLSTYFRPFLGQKRAYTHFKQDLSTSRLSSYDRNLQNIPDSARDIYEADFNIWSWLDYDQLEMRIMAEISQDPTLLAAYAKGEDIHWLTQQRLWPNTSRKDDDARLRSKTFNFAMQYRAAPFTLSKHTKLPFTICKDYRELWLDTYPGVNDYQLEQAALGWEHGWVENMLGRRCRLPTLDTATPDHIEKCAINYPIQSTGADTVKRAMLHPSIIHQDQALQVHDEILVDGLVDFPEALAHVGPLYTPFKVKYGPVWSKGTATHLSGVDT